MLMLTYANNNFSKFACMILVFLNLILAVTILLSADAKSKVLEDNIEALPVVAKRVKTSSICNQIFTSGEVYSNLSVDIYPKVSGQIIKVLVSEGSIVMKGDLLVEIDHRVLDAQLQQAQSAIEVAKANIEVQHQLIKTSQAALQAAKAQLESLKAQIKNIATTKSRLEKLFAEGAISKQQLDDITAQHDSIQAQIKAASSNVLQAEENLQANIASLKIKEAQLLQAQANFNVVKVQLEDSFIYAPFDGIITKKYLDIGSLANLSHPILRLEQIKPIKVIGSVSEKNYYDIYGNNNLKVEIISDSIRNKVITTQINKVYPTIDPKTRIAYFEILYANNDLLLRPGMFVKIKVILSTVNDAIVLDKQNLQRNKNEYYVLKINSDNTVERIKVDIGITQENLVEIKSGLKPGELIVSQGFEYIRNGTKVKPFITED